MTFVVIFSAVVCFDASHFFHTARKEDGLAGVRIVSVTSNHVLTPSYLNQHTVFIMLSCSQIS